MHFLLGGPELSVRIAPVPADHAFVGVLLGGDATAGTLIKCVVWTQVGSERIDDQSVVVVILANSRNFSNDRHTDCFQNRWITNARAFKHLRCPAGAGGNHDELCCFDGEVGCLGQVRLSLVRWVRDVLDTDRTLVVVEQDANDLGLAQHMQVRVLAVFQQRLDVCVCGISSGAIRSRVLERALPALVDAFRIFQICVLLIAELDRGGEPVLLGLLAPIGAARDSNRSTFTVMLVARTVVVLQLLQY